MNMNNAGRVLALISLFLLIAIPASGAPIKDDAIPPDLRQWKSWVLHDHEERFCPGLYNNKDSRKCSWASRLNLDLHKRGGRFSQEWLVFIKGRLPLPGGPENWPVEVTVNGKAAPVVGKGNVPSVYMEPGQHRIEGAFRWKEIPEMIKIPWASGLISLSINGTPVDFPLLDNSGRLWLQKQKVKQTREDRLEVRIFRLLRDTIPMVITNQININASGRSREIKLRDLLLDGAVPMSIHSPLPAMFGPGEELLMQVRPGRWNIRIDTRRDGPVNKIGPVKGKYGQEVWAFESRNHLRMVKIEGIPFVDPMQTDIPKGWKGFPAFIVRPGSKISFKEIRRGDPEPAPDQLHLRRIWWLDFNGKGLTAQDRITGSMSRQWYLAMNPPGLLGRVTVDGIDQLITEQGKGRKKKPGVELRKGRLNLLADSRFEASNYIIPAVGWDHDFQSVSAVLHLPPGWRLLTAKGVDVIPGTWFELWNLLDLFLILIIAMAVWKLRTWYWGLSALVTMGLIYHEPGSPRLVWLSLLASIALFRLLPDGWIKKLVNLWRLTSIITLLVLAIPFMVHQARLGIYPQLEVRRQHQIDLGFGAAGKTENTAVSSLGDVRTKKAKRAIIRKDAKKRLSYTSSYNLKKQQARQLIQRQAVLTQDPNALVQTGPGLPTWKWSSINMRWNGPVDRNQQIHLWLSSPTVNLVLSFLRIFLLTLLIVGLIDFRKWTNSKNGAVLLTFLLPFFLFPQTVKAENASNTVYPPDYILDQLKERLLEPSDCFPRCAESPGMELRVTHDYISILFEVHAATDTVVPLPGEVRSWLPEQVLLDGQPAKGLSRDKKGVLWILIPEGIHRVELMGKIPVGTAFQIPVPLRPRKGTVRSEGWEVRGIHPDGKVEANLQLTPEKKEGPGRAAHISGHISPFLKVERVLSLGLTWQVRTTLKRLTPTGRPVVISVPLIQGESVTTAGIRVEKGSALINMGPGTRNATWNSTLELSQAIRLKAPLSVPWTEEWVLDASPIWHCEMTGIPVIHHQDKAGYRKPQWRPWPGESVEIKVSRPRAIPGRSVTIDSANLKWIPGKRFNKGILTVRIRASRGGQHKIELPKGIRLQSVKINGKSQPIRQKRNDVVIPLKPGSQTVSVEWHQDTTFPVLISGPKVNIGQQAVNAHVTFKIPANRWILLAGGPRLGPAVLFWSYLIVVILAALALGRTTWTPLKTGHWLLLGLGLTQVHPLIAIMVVGWLLALGFRKNHSFPGGWFSFNMTQVILVLWTVAAMIGLYLSIKNGLLGIPDMQIAGNGSSNFLLNWTQDRIDGAMPRPWVLSLPLFVFRLLILFWALWLAYALLKWLRWGWQCFSEGTLWRKIRFRKKKEQAGPEQFEIGP